MCKSCRCSLHNKCSYGFSFQITLEKLSPGSQHLLSLLKQHLFFQVWQMQLCPCSHLFAILLKRWFSYPVTLTTSAVLSVLFWLLLLCCIKQKASSFSKLFLARACLVIFHSSLWNSDFHLQHPLATKIQKQLHPLCHCVLHARKQLTLNISKVTYYSPSTLSTKISLLLQLGNDQAWAVVCWDLACRLLSSRCFFVFLCL